MQGGMIDIKAVILRKMNEAYVEAANHYLERGASNDLAQINFQRGSLKGLGIAVGVIEAAFAEIYKEETEDKQERH